jgi:protein SCO1/2
VKVQKLFGDRMGDEIVFLSISIDPERDDPTALAAYRRIHSDDWTGWYHLTGDYDEIETLRWVLGAYDLDPVIDADRTEHAGVVTFGNDRTNWWAAVPALLDPHEVTDAIVRIAGNPVGRPR